MLISVVIPVYNGEKYLRECLESVKACPSNDIECIIINDGSKDGTEKIGKSFAEQDSRFKLINQKNAGVSEARNRGAAEASGEYIFFLDADDYIDTGKWPEILVYADEKKYDMIAFGYYNLLESGITEEEFPDDCNVGLAVLATTLLNTCWGKLLRREVINKNNIKFIKELKTCEDAVFIIDFIQIVQSTADILLCNEKVVYYRIHADSAMQSTKLENKLSDFAVLAERRKVYLAANYNEAAERAMHRQSFSIVTDLFRSYARKNKISNISKVYKGCLSNITVWSIITETKREYLLTFYKKFEHRLMRGKRCILLAVYFKIKGKL
jgi:glycosyltransferase involved in cell wall biosynthesis